MDRRCRLERPPAPSSRTWSTAWENNVASRAGFRQCVPKIAIVRDTLSETLVEGHLGGFFSCLEAVMQVTLGV